MYRDLSWIIFEPKCNQGVTLIDVLLLLNICGSSLLKNTTNLYDVIICK